MAASPISLDVSVPGRMNLLPLAVNLEHGPERSPFGLQAALDEPPLLRRMFVSGHFLFSVEVLFLFLGFLMSLLGNLHGNFV